MRSVSTDAASSVLRAVHRAFAGCIVSIPKVKSESWQSATFAGARLSLTVRLDGFGIDDKANAFAGDPKLELFGGHDCAEVRVVEQTSFSGAAEYVVLKLEILTVEIDEPLTRIPEPDACPAGAIFTQKDRAGAPWLLLGFLSGAVIITNAYPRPSTLRLYRFRTEQQAKAAAEVLVANSRLDLDGTTFYAPTVRAERELDGAKQALLRWAQEIDPLIRRRCRGMGPGHYSIAHKAEART